MRVAVLVSGRIARWRNNLETIINSLNETFEGCQMDYFASIHPSEESEDFLKLLNPVKFNVKAFTDFKSDMHPPARKRCLSSAYHRYMGMKLILEYGNYNWVVFTRADLKHMAPFCLTHPKDKTIYVPIDYQELNDPKFTDGLMPDHINMGNMEVMKIYSEMFLYADYGPDSTYTPHEKVCYTYMSLKGIGMERVSTMHTLDPDRPDGWWSVRDEFKDLVN